MKAEEMARRLEARAAADEGEAPYLTAIPHYMLHREAAALIRQQAGQIERLREALGSRVIYEEYDLSGDAPKFCGWFCDECKSVVEADGGGHSAECLAHGMKPA